MDSLHQSLAALFSWLDSRPNKWLVAAAMVFIGLAGGAACGMCILLVLVGTVPGLASEAPGATPQPVAVASPLPTSTLRPTATPSPLAAGTPEAGAGGTPEEGAAGTPEVAAGDTPEAAVSGTPTLEPTATATPEASDTPEATPTSAPTAVPVPATATYYAVSAWPGAPGQPGTVALPPAQTDPKKLDEAEGYYGQGKAAFDAQAWQEAINSFDQALALDPRHAQAYSYRGAAVRHIGDGYNDLATYLSYQDRAVADFSRGIAADPSWWGPYNERGASYHSRALVEPLRGDRRRWDEVALAEAVRASELDPAQPGPWYNRAAAHIGLGQYDQALAELEKSQPWTTATMSLAASACRLKGSLGEAMGHIQRAIDSAPQDPSLYLERSRIYLASADYARALDDANKAAELWGGAFGSGGAWYQKAAAEYYLGHFDRVEEYILTGRGSTWTDWGEPYYYLGEVYLYQGKIQEAVEALRWAEQTIREDSPVLAETRAELEWLQ